MANFAYTARDSAGVAVNGTMVAASIQEVGKLLRAEGKYPTSVKPVEEKGAGSSVVSGPAGIKIPRKDVIQMSQQLSIMLDTGVTISDALDCIAQQAIDKRTKALLKELSTDVQGGMDFSAALAKHPRSFPRIYVALIKASEKSGLMAKLLVRATNYLRDESEIIRKVRGALTYPGIMFAFAVSTTIFLLTFVLPKFTAIYAQKQAALPVLTKALMAVSDTLVGHWLVLLIIAIALGIGLYFGIRTPRGRTALHWVQLNMPVLGTLFRKLHLARGLRMIGTMANAGVNLVDCVTTANDLCPNSYFQKLWKSVQDQITSGKQLSEPLFASDLVPRSIAQMISSGEKSGKLGMVMEQVAGFSEAELKETITELTRYIEPAMIAMMGAIIGTVTLALMMPIFTISKVMSH